MRCAFGGIMNPILRGLVYILQVSLTHYLIREICVQLRSKVLSSVWCGGDL